ncbi:DUF58 domain-containing protein [Candidatus Woesearchaeota archaeon]|nr:DUF58 domain-containing protein [Candidatus Woesearchaeota archaeon]
MITTEFLDQLDKFHLIINKRVTSNYSGEKRSLAAGHGLTFKDHRIYAPGDDIRQIDWKVYARTDDLYLRIFEEERNLSVHIIIDASASMNFGKSIKKYDYAAKLAVGFAYLAMKGNEKFQFATFSEDLTVFRSKRGMNQLASMVYHLNNVHSTGHSNFVQSIFKYKKMINNRSFIVLLSDFLFNIDDIKKSLYVLGDHEIKVIQIVDPVEKDFLLSGDMRLKDSETKEMLKTHISPRLRQDYRESLSNHLASIEKTCNDLGIGFHSISTDTPIFDAFYSILK